MSRNPFLRTFEAEFNKEARKTDLIDMSASLKASPKKDTFTNGSAAEELFARAPPLQLDVKAFANYPYRRTSQSKTMTGGVHHRRDPRPTAAAQTLAPVTAHRAQTKKKGRGSAEPPVRHLVPEALQSRAATCQIALIAESAAHVETRTRPLSTGQLRTRKTAGVESVAGREKKKTGMASQAAHAKFASLRVST